MGEAAGINIDDSVLVAQWQGGDAGAMERLILRYQDRIFNVILRICGNLDDAAELTQDTFVKVIENIERFEQRSSFYTWTFRIAVNLTLNYCQRKARVGMGSLDAERAEQSGPARLRLKEILRDESGPGPAKVAEDSELCELVMSLLMKMDEEHRAVLVLRDIEGMDYSGIAKVLDLELGTVKSRLSRARGNLRERLEEAIR